MRNKAPAVTKHELILEIRRQVADATSAHSRELAANARAFELAQEVVALRNRVAVLEKASRTRKNAVAVASARLARRVARVGGLRFDHPGNSGTTERATGE